MAGSIRLRVRGPQGVITLNIDSNATWSDLIDQISEKSGVTDFDLKIGYPPQPLEFSSSETKLSDIPHKLNGEQLIVTPKITQATGLVVDETLTSAKKSTTSTTASREHHDQPLKLKAKKRTNVEEDPPEVPVPLLDGVMVLRVMPDDNSCMFRALSSAVLGSALDGMTELRSVVVQTIQAQPSLYTEGMLEKKPAEYCRWIQREDSWGGGIELSILSQHFDIEICSINVQDCRVDKFNEGKPTRCILVYSGIHYDVLAVTPFSGAEPEFDRKVFDVMRIDGEEFDGGAVAAAVELCRGLQKRHYFTDTHKFALKCNQCGQSGNGQQWAVRHAKATGHGDFGEGD